MTPADWSTIAGDICRHYDDYDGFGDTTNLKLAANLRVTDGFRLRGWHVAILAILLAIYIWRHLFPGVPAPFRRAFGDGIKGLIRNAKLDPGQTMTAEEIAKAVMEVYKNDDAINPEEYKSVLARLYTDLANRAAKPEKSSAA